MFLLYILFFFISLDVIKAKRNMANKRILKRTINYVCSDLFAECIASSLYSGNSEDENTNALLVSILVMHNDFVRRVSHPEPGLKPKTYYKALTNDLNKQIDEIIGQINNIE